jgi:drug/metabolite transporter (DMT)-like permease
LTRPRGPYAALVIATLAVSFSAIFIRLSTAAAPTVVAYRMAFAALLLAPLLLTQPQGPRWPRAAERPAFALAGVLLGLHFLPWTLSLSYTSVASSVLFVSMHPVLVALLAWILFRERISRSTVVGIALAVLGSAIIGGGDFRLSGRALTGDLLALLGAAGLAGYLLLGRRIRRDYSAVAYSLPVYAIAALTAAVVGGAFGDKLWPVRTVDLGLFFLLATVSTLGGHTVYNYALRHLPVSVVAVSFLGEPVGAALLAWILLRERPAASVLVGGAVVLAGLYLATRQPQAVPAATSSG